ncbi:hypothetical protein D3C76_1457670 [compost metagenome]
MAELHLRRRRVDPRGGVHHRALQLHIATDFRDSAVGGSHGDSARSGPVSDAAADHAVDHRILSLPLVALHRDPELGQPIGSGLRGPVADCRNVLMAGAVARLHPDLLAVEPPTGATAW